MIEGRCLIVDKKLKFPWWNRADYAFLIRTTSSGILQIISTLPCHLLVDIKVWIPAVFMNKLDSFYSMGCGAHGQVPCDVRSDILTAVTHISLVAVEHGDPILNMVILFLWIIILHLSKIICCKIFYLSIWHMYFSINENSFWPISWYQCMNCHVVSCVFDTSEALLCNFTVIQRTTWKVPGNQRTHGLQASSQAYYGLMDRNNNLSCSASKWKISSNLSK